MSTAGVYGLVFGLSLITAVLVTPLARWLSIRLGVVARPGGRRTHEGAMPKLGGIPLLLALLLAWGVIYWQIPPQPGSTDSLLLPGVMLGSVLICLGGFLDDWFDLPPLAQTAVHLVAALVAIQFDVFIELFTSPFGPAVWQVPPLSWFVTIEPGNIVKIIRPLAIVFTLFWILGMINAVNWLDGLDGLSAGVGTVAAAVFTWHSYMLQQETVAAFPLALTGALIGFLFFNFAPAKIYLGSAGAYLLGFQLATLSIISPAKVATALLVLVVPILDVAWRIVDRMRQGRSPFSGDRGHLHHLLVDSGVPVQRIVLGYYGVTILFGMVVLWLPTPGLKFATLLLLATAVLGLLFWLSARVRRQPKQDAMASE